MQGNESAKMTAWGIIAPMGVPSAQEGELVTDRMLEMIYTLPEIIDLILADFDYQKNIESNTAIACRALASYWNAIFREKLETALRKESEGAKSG